MVTVGDSLSEQVVSGSWVVVGTSVHVSSEDDVVEEPGIEDDIL